jgi:hypothetical protein
MVFVRRILAEHEYVIAHDLRVIRGVIARCDALIFIGGNALVGTHRQMTSETARRP